ncbi:hypothetical protein AVEN_221596-1 [Araneus ventricosus]|uniref:Uncharacterized protein n=1 Tax=Araneus ventricosus TaxID=182803 RepID=A0A4Y2PT97_ARAVE|nr:hypothetical protein AVEN_221596-1 [Araneus ventricosus]
MVFIAPFNKVVSVIRTMDLLKRKRTQLRRLFPKSLKEVEAVMKTEPAKIQQPALKTLGAMSEKYESMLHPLVESALPEYLIKEWVQMRSRVENKDKTNILGTCYNSFDRKLKGMRGYKLSNQVSGKIKGFKGLK